MTILFLTKSTEENALRLTEICDYFGVASFIITSEDYSTDKMRLTTLFGSNTKIRLNRRGKIINLNVASISGVWTRGIDFGIKPSQGMFAENLSYHEWKYYLTYLTREIDSRLWMNWPPALQKTANKPFQLASARRFGFEIPETIITNSVEDAKDFHRRFERVIIKLIGEGIPNELGDRGIFTKFITDSMQLEYVANCPTLLQRAIEKKFDLRVTVIDESVFCAALEYFESIDSSIDSRECDYSQNSYFRYNLSGDITSRITAFVRSLGLRYAAIDLVVDKNDNIYFLEVNNSGQWSYIEYMTGYPISETIIRSLIR